MSSSDYEDYIAKKLVERFQDEFFSKIGYIPIVMLGNREDILPRIPLEQLKKLVNQEIPDHILSETPCISLKNRNSTLVDLRYVFSSLARKMGYSYPDIARALRVDHTTVMYYMDNIESRAIERPIMIALSEMLINTLKTGSNVPEPVSTPCTQQSYPQPILPVVLQEAQPEN